MNQSLALVILQIIGVLVGVFSVFFIAGSLPSDVYAIVGVYNIISVFILVFSNTGIETYGIRNILSWNNSKSKQNEIKLLVTQSIVFRFLFAMCISVLMLIYVYYISEAKFHGQYLELFIAMSLLSVTRALNDSTILLLKAFNKYFLAALASYSVNVFGKIIALFLFFNFGFSIYIYFLICLPLFITLPVLYLLRKWISFNGVFKKKNIINSYKNSNKFAISSYISYGFNYLDQFLISIFTTAEILGSFTVAKNIFNISKTFIENIFDPLIQNLVRFKNDSNTLNLNLKRIFKLRNILLVVSIILIIPLYIFLDDLIAILQLDKYIYLNFFIFIIYLSQILSIAFKVKYNFISLFYSDRYYLKLTIIYSLSSILFFVFISNFAIKFIFSYSVLTNLLILFYTNMLFKKNKYL